MSNFIFYFVLLVILGFSNQNGNQFVSAVFTNSNLANNYYQTVNNNNFTDDSTINNNNDCLSDRLVVYKVVFHTYWTRELFPKHYPDWRPPAQWTKTIGKSHDSSFRLFNIGQPASAGVKQFAETGKSDILDNIKQQQQQQQQQAQSGLSSSRKSQTLLNNILDDFDIPSIMAGGGRNEGKFFADAQHSFVSLITRIVPSPDWFIGVDSFQLCVGGTWIDSVTIDQDPLDAGTDNGFTFTAPNWPTNPQGVIYRITARYPAHPAGSFFYPKSKRLPPIATFQFIKLKEYELSEVFNFDEDERKYEMVKTRTHLETEHNHVEMNNELSASIEKERQNEVTVIPIVNTQKERVRAKLLAKMNTSMNKTDVAYEYINMIPTNINNHHHHHPKQQQQHHHHHNPNGIIENIAINYATRKHKKRINRPPRDCRVGHWTDWSPCSQTCGIGEMHKHRKVIKHAKRGGRPCPPLQQSKWCGTSTNCQSSSINDFNW